VGIEQQADADAERRAHRIEQQVEVRGDAKRQVVLQQLERERQHGAAKQCGPRCRSAARPLRTRATNSRKPSGR
jgi:hypothetical protein